MRKLSVIAAILALACSSRPPLPREAHGETALEVRGAVTNGPYRLGRHDLAALPRGTVRGVDPRSGRAATFEGPSLATMLVERSARRKDADTVIVRTADGAAIAIPLTLIRQLKPVLADRVDGVPVPTPVIAWPTEEQKGLATDPRAASWWARDVVALELAEWSGTIGAALRTPSGASDAARLGADHFGGRCIGCHELRGFGGRSGPELTQIVARLSPEAFAPLLQHHPDGAAASAPSRMDEADAAELWAFLRAVGVTDSASAGTGSGEPGWAAYE